MIDPVSRKVAANVRLIRKRRRLSQSELADRCDRLGFTHIDRSVLSKIESPSERRRVSVDELVVLSKALGVDAAQLLGDGPEVPALAELTKAQEWVRDTPSWLSGGVNGVHLVGLFQNEVRRFAESLSELSIDRWRADEEAFWTDVAADHRYDDEER